MKNSAGCAVAPAIRSSSRVPTPRRCHGATAGLREKSGEREGTTCRSAPVSLVHKQRRESSVRVPAGTTGIQSLAARSTSGISEAFCSSGSLTFSPLQANFLTYMYRRHKDGFFMSKGAMDPLGCVVVVLFVRHCWS